MIGHIINVNSAHAVRGPKYVVKKGKTPVLIPEEAQALLDAIDTTSLAGQRDRDLIGVMICTFARINTVLQMKVGGYYSPPLAVKSDDWLGIICILAHVIYSLLFTRRRL